MARKSRGDAGKKNTAKRVNQTKKDKNVFKVADQKSKSRPREVQVKLKKMKATVQSKQEKIDTKLKELHKDMVVKKDKPKIPAKSGAKKSKAPVNTKKVQQKLEKMEV